jgi:hypothetical protein
MRWQNVSVMHSQAWNGALTTAEAGIEEGLAQLNPSALLFNTNIDRGANGWTLQADGLYHAPRRTLGDNYYDVAISADPLPSIYATGYVRMPALSATISRSVAVTTSLSTLFRGAAAARVNVDLKGNYISTDSFISTDPNYSTNGRYDAAKRRAGGDIASTGGVINVQNADVMGTLYTGPNGSYTVGSQGSVGDVAWVLGGSNGLQPGHYKNDFNMDFPDVLAPYQSAAAPASGTISGADLAALSVDAFGWPEFYGALTGMANLESAGASISELMRNLDGAAQISVVQGQLGGIDLDSALHRIDKSPLALLADIHRGRTAFERAGFGLRFVKGVAGIEQGELENSSLRLGFGGTVNFGERGLDLHAVAMPSIGEAKPGKEIPKFRFDVGGSWDDLAFTPDVRGLIRRSGAAAPLFPQPPDVARPLAPGSEGRQ